MTRERLEEVRELLMATLEIANAFHENYFAVGAQMAPSPSTTHGVVLMLLTGLETATAELARLPGVRR